MAKATETAHTREAAAAPLRAALAAVRPHLKCAAVIFAVALAARIFWVVYVPADPTDLQTMDDTIFYHGSATSLAEGKGYLNPWVGYHTAQWPPGYSFLLAAVYWLPGPDVPAAWSTNILLGTLTCVALYWLGVLVAGQRAGALAGFIFAVFPGHVFFSTLVMSESLFVLIVVIAMALLALSLRGEEPGVPLLLLIGAALAAAALVRGQGLFMLVVAFLLWGIAGGDWAKALRRTAVVTVTALALIMPWTIRNYVAMDAFVFISTNDGGNLFMGHNENSNGRFNASDTWIGSWAEHLSWEEREVETSNVALREGLKFMFTHPWREAQLSATKIRALYEDDEDALRWIHHPDISRPVPFLKVISDVANAYYFAAIAAAGLGLLCWSRRPQGLLLLPLLIVAVFTAGQLLFFATSRFHLPMLPSFALLAATGLVWAVPEARSRLRSRRCR
ncbi:MAG: glycosyltransferase family 39 protein [Dehalococcoidia bacterium]|nr:glycosyltransferase family 39 protein [Dehalococcoidia bacterium]